MPLSYSLAGLKDSTKFSSTKLLGNVPIIVYGSSFRRDSLFQDVLKRPGTFKNVIKFSKIGQI